MYLRNLALLLTMAVFVAGCGTGSPDSRVQVNSGVATDTARDNNLTRIVTNPISDLFGDGIDIQNVNKRFNTAGFLDVNVKGYNRAKKIKQFQYKFQWFDVNDFPLDTQDTTWKNLSAQPGTEFNFFGTAPRKEAVDFKLYVRKNY